MPRVEVSVAEPQQQDVLANLIQLYTHDFSEHWAGGPQGELGEDGRFAAYPLDAYWQEPDRIPLLIRVGGRLAGFALVNAYAHSGRSLDRAMAEFFIVRKHRRGGVGLTAAQQVFGRYPGLWEAAVARRNTGALAFWRRAAATHPQVGEIEELDLASEAWNGPILRFRIN